MKKSLPMSTFTFRSHAFLVTILMGLVVFAAAGKIQGTVSYAGLPLDETFSNFGYGQAAALNSDTHIWTFGDIGPVTGSFTVQASPSVMRLVSARCTSSFVPEASRALMSLYAVALRPIRFAASWDKTVEAAPVLIRQLKIVALMAGIIKTCLVSSKKEILLFRTRSHRTVGLHNIA